MCVCIEVGGNVIVSKGMSELLGMCLSMYFQIFFYSYACLQAKSVDLMLV